MMFLFYLGIYVGSLGYSIVLGSLWTFQYVSLVNRRNLVAMPISHLPSNLDFKMLTNMLQLSSSGIEIPYVLLVYEADEFCDLVKNEFLMDHVSCVQSHYPTHTVCYLTNKLFSYINKRSAETLSHACLVSHPHGYSVFLMLYIPCMNSH